MKAFNQQCLISELVAGDRFFFAGDKKKEIYTVAAEKTFFVQQQKQWHIKYISVYRDIDGAPGPKVEVHKLKDQSGANDRRVIFLRNINDKKQELNNTLSAD
jgi:hypothetical protein